MERHPDKQGRVTLTARLRASRGEKRYCRTQYHDLYTSSSCSDVSIALVMYLRTHAMAWSLGRLNNFFAIHAANVPVLPTPPEQWIATFLPALAHSIVRSTVCASFSIGGMLKSAMGRCIT